MTKGKTFGSFLGALLALLAAWYTNQPKPQPPIVIPSPTVAPTLEPSPLPTPFPTPSVAATPEPTATPTPSDIALCRLPPSNGLCQFPPTGEASYAGEVADAQEQAKQNGYLTPGGRVKDEALYTNEVARLMRVMGTRPCAINGSDAGHTSQDEVWVKGTNSESQHFDVIRHDGYPITLFAARCQPAKF